ncbi:TonB-dependent receptor [Kordiimonas sp.]|uniref:TonB-dependent receptor n=1 Tax=Kordiimonas sp. TaxID=1970157 RepID=UPI003A8DCA01
MKRSRQSLLMLGTILGSSMMAVPVAAQSADTPDADVVVFEEVSVVGSRIKRKDEVSNSPVFTLSGDDLAATGLVSLGEMLQELPGVGFSLNSNGSGGVSHGTSSINLRNLGANRALVLVNGHRWVAGSGTRGFRDFVDMNTIPQAIVGRVEVLKDGATAIYGADAIAGVINIHTKKLEGFEVNAYGGTTTRGDGESLSFDASWGQSFDRGSVLVSAMYTDQKEIYTEDRELTRVPLNSWSTTNPNGRFTGTPLGGTLTRIEGTNGTSPDDFRAYEDPADRTNIYDHTYVTGPLRRYSIWGQAEYQVSDNIHATAEILYNNRRSDQLFSPITTSVRGSYGYELLADHPYNPFGQDFPSNMRLDRQLNELGQRVNEQNVETWRFAAGLDGEFSNGWSWDVFYSYGKNDSTFDSYNQANLEHLALGLGSNERCAAVSGCVPINYFGPLTAEMVEYLRYNSHDEHGTRQHDVTANITGDLFDMPAGVVGFAAGFEYRRESAFDNPDSYVGASPIVNSYRTTSSAPREASSGSYDLYEFYTELNVPLLKDLPLVHDLNVDAAVRYSHYSTFGDTTNTKFGIGWRPVEDLLIRATFAEGFRAPSILEATPAMRATNLVANDPCSGGGAGLVGCAGVPASYEQVGNAVTATVSGNPDLQPETSRNYSVGAVLTPKAVPGLSLSVDWYRIKVSDTITSLGSQRILNLCANTGEKCSLITRDSATGEIINLLDGPVNLNTTTVEGWDMTARYQLDGIDMGDFTFLADASYLANYTDELVNDDGSITVQEREGTSNVLRESIPKWRGKGSVQWHKGQWSATYSARLIGSTDEDPDDPLAGDIPAVWYHDISATYDLENQDMSVTLGVENIFDKQPPVSFVNTNVNFDINTYNARGTFAYLRFTARFGG